MYSNLILKAVVSKIIKPYLILIQCKKYKYISCFLGNGLSRLWQQMLAILPNSSLEISRAICAKYRTPLELYEVSLLNKKNEILHINLK